VSKYPGRGEQQPVQVALLARDTPCMMLLAGRALKIDAHRIEHFTSIAAVI
jgi:hypothetical protein